MMWSELELLEEIRTEIKKLAALRCEMNQPPHGMWMVYRHGDKLPYLFVSQEAASSPDRVVEIVRTVTGSKESEPDANNHWKDGAFHFYLTNNIRRGYKVEWAVEA